MFSKTAIQSWVVFLGIFMFSGLTAYGQDIINMSNGTVTACDGVFRDDDAATDGAYSVGGNYTFTICPDTPGDVVSVLFNAFALFTSPNPQNSDYLYIFDGDSDAAPSLGNYTGTTLQGLPVTGTVNNTSGCLTFVFYPNPDGNTNFAFPGWEAAIECTTPCANPTSASQILDPAPLPGVGQSVGICLNEPITFQDMGSQAAAGFNLQYWVWNFDDGTIDTLSTAANATHTYTEPGEYLVTLVVVDHNGCRSMNLEPLQVLVSTIPIFNTNTESPVCIGSDGTSLDGSPVQSITWTSLPPQVVAGVMYLPDGAGFAYESSLTFDFFEEGSTLENCEDFIALTINMEHSWLGDLSMTITCPDGTQVQLLSYPNGGNSTFLGEALNDNGTEPGTGWDYGWSPSATNGTIDDADNKQSVTFVDNNGTTTTYNIVNPGIYESEGDLCDLVGCPMNGEWTYSIQDNWAIDNGFLFEWGIDFNPELFPDITTFTPVVGMGPDSTWWEGPNVNTSSEDGNTINTTYTTPGFYDYTFFATNNFGCTFDTLITIEVIEGPDITAGPDLTFCDEPVTLQAGLTGNDQQCGQESGNYTYCYGHNENMIVTYCPDNPGDGVTFMEMIINDGSVENNWDYFYVYDGDDITAPELGDSPYTGDLSGLTFTASMNNPTGCLTFRITSDGSVSCQSSTNYDDIDITVSCGGGLGLEWQWTPTTGLSDPNVQNPTAFVNQATTYTVTAFPIGFPGCLISDQVTVAPDEMSDPGLDTDSIMCYNSPISFLTDYLEGNPVLGGVWTNNATGEVVDNQLNPSTYVEGANFSFTYTVTNGTCEMSSQLNITILPVTDQSCCQTNAEAGTDAIPCGLSYELQAEQTVGVGTWTAGPDIVFSDIHDPHATVTCTTPGGGARTLTWTDDNGYLCKVSDEIVVNFADPLDILIIAEDALCFDGCSGKAIGIADGGTTTGGNYVFDWFEEGKPGLIPATRDSLCAGVYMVKIFDDLGCADSTTFEIGEPRQQEIFVTTTPPLCAESCDGEINVISEGAVSYSYDGGENYVSESRAIRCEGEYTVIAKNQNGCEITQNVHLIDPPKFVANFNINPLPTTIKNTTITFQDISAPGPLKISQYTFGKYPVLGTDNSRISTFTFPRDTAGVYPVTLMSTSLNGCADTLTKNVIIKDDLLWYIPNSFSPNEDGINDVWRPVGATIDVKDYKLTIMDRWGRQVFTTTDINEGWNGSVKGDGFYSDAGVYTYLIKVTSATTKEKHELTGFITLLRQWTL